MILAGANPYRCCGGWPGRKNCSAAARLNLFEQPIVNKFIDTLKRAEYYCSLLGDV
jgi:hypothetical protein